MKKFIFTFVAIIATISCSYVATYDISQIDQVKIVKEYPEGTNTDDMDTVTFGRYYQKADSYNKTNTNIIIAGEDQDKGKDPVEWLVLKKQGDKALLLSKYVIEDTSFDKNVRYYDNPEMKKMSRNIRIYDYSYLTQWLRNYLVPSMFNMLEQQTIVPTSIKTKIGHSIPHKLFILSIQELEEYLGNNIQDDRYKPKWTDYLKKEMNDTPNYVIMSVEPTVKGYMYVGDIECTDQGNILHYGVCSEDSTISSSLRLACWVKYK